MLSGYERFRSQDNSVASSPGRGARPDFEAHGINQKEVTRSDAEESKNEKSVKARHTLQLFVIDEMAAGPASLSADST
jgi:hypothetical protein